MTKHTCAIDDIVIPDDVFDIEEEGPIHDQLPSVEEAKINAPSKPSKLAARKNRVAALLITGLVLVAGLFTFTKSNNKIMVEFFDNRIEKVILFLRQNNISDEPSLRDHRTPQHQAVRFIAEGDAYRMELTEENAEHFVERYVLSLLYYALEGPEWSYSLNFLSARNHCEWNTQFTSSLGHELHEGVLCDENGHVKKLMIAYNNVKGSLPMEVQFLGQLEALHMQFNPKLHGNFPIAFRYMPNLKSVGLQHCNLQGSLPSWMGELTQLTGLALGDNKFYGSVPSSISQMRNLKFLALDGLGLSGQIDSFKNMYQLETLFLANNVITGEIANALEHWRHLAELDLSNNMLDGPIPKSLFNIEKLMVADLSHNLLDGQITEDIYQNTQLQYLALQHNAIKGTIPDRIGFLEKLKHLDLSFNGFSGTIPDTIEGLTDLRSLATSVNLFDNQKMLDLSKLTNLLDLSMKSNELTGTIPDWVGGLSNLKLLDLDANNLSGSIPTWMGLLTDLKHLLLNRNQLTGTLPTQLAQMRKLDVLLLDSNSITGSAEAICGESHAFQHFITDCFPGQDGKAPEIDCRCCTTCCSDEAPDCNDKQWTTTSNNDPIWEYGVVRPSYRFDLTNAPAMYSKQTNGDTFDAQP